MPEMRSSIRLMPEISSSSSGRMRTAVVVSGMPHSSRRGGAGGRRDAKAAAKLAGFAAHRRLRSPSGPSRRESCGLCRPIPLGRGRAAETATPPFHPAEVSMSPARSRAIVLASSLLFASLVVTLARAQECGVRHEETVTGGSSNLLSVTSGTVQGVPYQLYLVAVSNRKDPSPSGQHAVTGVTGMGLTCQRLHTSPDYQCSQTGKTRVTVWWAVGTASVSSGPVTATFGVVGGDTSYTVTNAVIAVTRYSGVDPTVPFGTMIRGNTRGLDGSCGTPGITDTDNYQFPLVTNRNNSQVWCATAIRYA